MFKQNEKSIAQIAEYIPRTCRGMQLQEAKARLEKKIALYIDDGCDAAVLNAAFAPALNCHTRESFFFVHRSAAPQRRQPVSKIDYQELREKAEKATKGSYIVGHTSVNQHGNLTGVFVCQKWKGEPGGVIAECHVNCLVETDAQAYANAEFIAAFNPNV
ncbi:TPA: ead/Ea22-like family protein, partial [Escherichia coli]